MKIINIDQRSEDWFKVKAGVPSASDFDRILTPKTLKPSAQRVSYMNQLAGERITGMKQDSYMTQAMVEGIEREAEARDVFAFITGLEGQEVGFCLADNGKYGCSPDWLMPNTGLEIKNPKLHTHVGYLREGVVPADYILQVQGSMLVAGFNTWYFFSYFPGLPPLLLLVERNNNICTILAEELEKFCYELDQLVKQIGG